MMISLCSYCLNAVPMGWPADDDCVECAALESAARTLAYSARLTELTDRDAYFDRPQATWRTIAGLRQSQARAA